MESGQASELYKTYAPTTVYVAVEDENEEQSIGSAVHVGEGVFVTARHVVDGKRIVEVASTVRAYIPLEGEEAKHAKTFIDGKLPVRSVPVQKFNIKTGPHFHPDDRIDIAVFEVDHIDPYTPVAQLGTHLDDWIGDELVLSEVVILGYPPIPLTREPILVAARAEINAVVDLHYVPHVHFVLSAMPRGGFSGGVAISEYGFALGIVTQSLLRGDLEPELGYFTVVSVEPIYSCLSHHRLLPQCQAVGWDGMWNTKGKNA